MVHWGFKYTNPNKPVISALLFSVCCFLLDSSPMFSQDATELSKTKKIQFSGSINLNTNGISPVPAFSLDKPSIIGTCSVDRKRLSFNPELAFSTKGKPWFINPRFTYKALESKKFDFSIGTIYSLSYSYPEVLLESELRSTTELEHYALLQSTSRYQLSEKIEISLTSYHGFGLGSASIERGNFFILGGNFNELQLTNNFYYNVIPQLTYINLDGDTEGLFASGTLGIGCKKLPFVLSTQLSQSLASNISPEPGFKWNVGLTYNF